MNPKYKKTLLSIMQILSILLIGVFSIWIASLFSKANNNSNSEEIAKAVVEQVIVQKPQCPATYQDYLSAKSTDQTVILASNFNSYGIANEGFAKEDDVTIQRTGSGSEIACGYLDAITTRSGKPLGSYENIYFKAGGYGGHLSNNSAIVDNTTASTSEMLWGLNNISYSMTRDMSNLSQADFSELLNVSNTTNFEIALNTTDPTGELIEVSLTYECWDPSTGKVTQDCHLSVAN